ncbi:unnamed protein product, partial [Didymodactylos carnosus]
APSDTQPNVNIVSVSPENHVRHTTKRPRSNSDPVSLSVRHKLLKDDILKSKIIL